MCQDDVTWYHRRVHQLITIAFSHYCEKARWVLDRNGVPYREHKYMPALHIAAAHRALAGTGVGRSDKVSSGYSTPILFGEGTPIADSSDIMRFIEPALFNDPEATRLDRYFSDALGPHSRRMVYWYGFTKPSILLELAKQNVSRRQAALFRVGLPFVTRFIRSRLQIDRASYERSKRRVLRIVGEVSDMLGDGRKFLVADRFSAADLSFAAMISPGILPDPGQYGAVLPTLEQLPAEAQELVGQIRATPAGHFATRMFSEQRFARGVDARAVDAGGGDSG